MDIIYKGNEAEQAEAAELRKSRDLPLFEQLHQFYAHVHEDVVQKYPRDALLMMVSHPPTHTKQQQVSNQNKKFYLIFLIKT